MGLTDRRCAIALDRAGQIDTFCQHRSDEAYFDGTQATPKLLGRRQTASIQRSDTDRQTSVVIKEPDFSDIVGADSPPPGYHMTVKAGSKMNTASGVFFVCSRQLRVCRGGDRQRKMDIVRSETVVGIGGLLSVFTLLQLT